MPQLVAARFESIGHPAARLENLTLRFSDRDGAPCDSVLWLRNGGGKSSLLNLVFSLLRPHQREFLGSEAEARVRELSDYLAPDDTGTVSLEWRLDASDEPSHLITGVAMELARSAGHSLQRMFFAIRVDPEAAGKVAIESLPLYVIEGGQRSVRRIASLRQALQDLERVAGVRVVCVERQSDWARELESFQLDPEVFGYQLRMNRREGAADELFRFASPREFVDFVLEMALPDDDALVFRENLQRFKQQVQQRPALVAEQLALDRTVQQLDPLVALAAQRRGVVDSLDVAADELALLHERVAATRAHLEGVTTEAKARSEELDQRVREAAYRYNKAAWTLVVLRAEEASIRESDRVEADVLAERVQRQAEHALRLLEFARLLRDIDESEARIMVFREELDRREEGARPLRVAMQEAAASFRDALAESIAAVDGRAEALRLRREASAARDESLRADERTAQSRAARVEAQVEEGERRFQRIGALRDALARDQWMLPGENAAAAQSRWEGQRREAELAERTSEEARAAADEAATVAMRRGDQLEGEVRLAKQEAARIERAMDAARRRWSELSRDALVQRVLEDSSPDLLALSAEASTRLNARARRLAEEHVNLRVQQSGAARALEHLRSRSLLPSSIDAERVQHRLREAGVTAFTGGEFLAQNQGGDAAAQRIVEHPALAAGVVVSDDDLARATEVLAGAMPEVDAPVAIGTKRALLGAGSPGHVVLPRRAVYDRHAATAELDRRQAEEAPRERQMASIAEEQSQLAKLSSRLDQLREEHPTAWFEERERERGVFVQRATAAEQEAATERATEVEARRRGRAAEEERRRAVESQRRGQRGFAEVQRLIDAGGDDVDALVASLADLRDDLASAREAVAAIIAERVAVAAERAQIDRLEDALRVERVPLEHERNGALGDCAEGVGGERVPIDIARAQYQARRDRYHREAGQSVIAGQIDNEQKAQGRLRVELSRRLREYGATVAEAVDALDAARSTVGLEAAEAEARQAIVRAGTEVAEARAARRVAEAVAAEQLLKVAALEREGRGALIEETRSAVRGWTLEALQRHVEVVRANEAEANQERQEAEGARKLARERLDHAQGEMSALELIEVVVRGAVERHAQGAMRGRRRGDDAPPFTSLDGIKDRSRELVTAIDRQSAALAELETRAGALGRALSSFASDAENASLPQALRDRLRDADVGALLARAEDYRTEVSQRRDVIADKLTEVDRHRKLLAQELDRAADPALRLLRRLERASVFPPSVAVWGDEPFIKVRVRDVSLGERQAVAASLIDELVQAGDLPSGLRLVLRMVQELTRGDGIAVTILKPEAHRRLLYESVERLRSFSRGEQLTAAILLYCTLARVRAEQRGGRRSPTSVLLLDNPLGTCSQPALVELQRAMAAAHGVQLVYTTGIEDLQALALMPNVLRLRNAHRDAQGRRRVTSEGGGAMPINVARIARAEEPR